MDTTGGMSVYPKPKAFVYVDSGFSDAVYLLLGFMSCLSMKVTLYDIVLLTERINLQGYGRWCFATNMVAWLIFLFLISSCITFLFFPLNTLNLCISVWTIPVCHMIQIINLGFLSLPLAKYIYIIVASVLSIATANINMIAMSRSADVPSGKYLNKTLMVLIGNMLGEFGNRLIIIIIDLQSDVITSSDLETSMFMWLFSIIPITIGSILASIHLYFRSLGASINDVYRENIRFSNAKRQYNIAKYALQRCIPMVSLVWVIQAIEGFFNTGAVVCTIDAFPQISNSFECALILIFMAFLDLTGRCIVIFMNLLGYKIERNKSIVSNSESTHKFKTSISYLWVSIAFIRIPSALLLLLGRHYRDVLGTFLEANVIATISTLNRFLRGIIIGLVYYSLYSTAYEESLKFYNLPPKVSINEPLECMDQRVTSANSAVLVIPLVYLIEIVIMLISLYFGFKYQMLIFEAENLDNSTWPTDFTDNHGKKFWYWISNIMYSVFQDIEYPFGLCK